MDDRNRVLIETAFIWKAEGIPIVPCLPKSKECHLHWRTFEAATQRYDLLRYWFSTGSPNLAVVCGVDSISTTGSGLVILDFDDPQAWQTWQQKAGDLAATYCETTARGVHAFYKVDKPESRTFDLCEVLGLGHLCLVYPSIHPTGKPYQVLGDPGEPIRATKSELLFSLLSKEKAECDTAAENDGRQFTSYLAQVRIATNSDNAGADLITRLKAAYPLLGFAESITDLKPSRASGRWFLGKCPLHEDKQPSMWVDAERQCWGCYSPECKGHQGGDVINLFALAHGLTVQQAIKIMGEKIHAGR